MRLLAPVILVLGSLGCAGRDTPGETRWIPDPAFDLGAIVARVGSVPVYAHEVQAQAAASRSTLRAALDDLISMYLLAESAHRRQRFLPDWWQSELRSALAERVLERDLESQLQRENVSEGELRAVYQKNINVFVHPRLVDIGLLAVYTGPVMKSAPRLLRAETARALAASLAGRNIRGPEDFEALGKDPAWRTRHVNYSRVWQGLDEPLSRKVGTAVARLRARGDTTPLIEDENGYFLATYAGEKPPENIPFAEVREMLLERIYEQWRGQRREELMRKLAEGHRIERHPHLLERL